MGKLPPELQPKHGILEANPTVRSDFLEKVHVSSIIPHRASIETFVEDGLVLTNGTKLGVDDVISCTGYLVRSPRLLPKNSFLV